MAYCILNDRDRDIVRWLAAKSGQPLDRAEVLKATGLSNSEYEQLLPLLAKAGFVEQIPIDDGVLFSGFQVQPAIQSLDRQIGEPPKPKPTFLQAHPYLGPIIGATISSAVVVVLWLLSRK